MPKADVASVTFFCSTTKRFLLLKRTAKGDEGGTWCAVGGGVEDGETAEEALVREVAEETRYTQPFTPIFVSQNDTFRGLVINHYVAVVAKEFLPILNDEHSDFMWTTELPALLHPGYARYWHTDLKKRFLNG